ncbi:hypothetical protein IC582_012460 [Cucumis melo]
METRMSFQEEPMEDSFGSCGIKRASWSLCDRHALTGFLKTVTRATLLDLVDFTSTNCTLSSPSSIVISKGNPDSASLLTHLTTASLKFSVKYLKAACSPSLPVIIACAGSGVPVLS